MELVARDTHAESPWTAVQFKMNFCGDGGGRGELARREGLNHPSQILGPGSEVGSPKLS